MSNHFDHTLSIIDAQSNTLLSTIPAGVHCPTPLVVNPAGTRVYVASEVGLIAVIDTATDSVTATISVGTILAGVALNAAGTRLYATDLIDDTLSVIDTATSSVAATVPVGPGVYGVAAHPDGTRVYVANTDDDSVLVIDARSLGVTATISVGGAPNGVAVDSTGAYLYVVNEMSNSVSVIATATDVVIATIEVGEAPFVIGQFVAPQHDGAPPAPMDGDGCSLAPGPHTATAATGVWVAFAMLLLRRLCGAGEDVW